MSATLLDDALKLMSCGVSIIPIKQDGSKRPAVAEWAPYQQRLATSEEAVEWFSDGRNGIAAICGPVSGGLEIMDFDIPGKPGDKIPPAWKPWCEMLKEHGHDDLLEKLVICSTPSGGRHVVYRCKGVKDGNMKLAQCEDSKPLIETRGVGGYFAISPTKGYAELRGAVRWAPEITEAEREILHVCARLLNEKSDRVAYEKNYPAGRRPGDDYNLRGETMAELLMRHGWRPVQGREGRWANFTRPDKQEGISGGISASSGLFHAFTTSTPFDAGKGYSKFSVYCVLEHNGDFVMAARALADRGFGGERERSAQVARDYQSTKYPGTVELDEADEDLLWGTGDTFKEIPVDWFWPDRIPLGALTMIQGDPGIGKSTITMALAATATIGGILPGGHKVDPCHVVLFACEDDPGRVVVPRMKALGCDLTRLSLVATDKKRADGTPVFDGVITVDMIMRRCLKMRARVLILDPLIESLAALGIDPCKSQEVRPFLAKLRNFGEVHGMAVIIVHHQNKNSGGKSLYRAVGSIDIPAACRSVFAVGSDPNAPEIKAMAHVKSNWAALQPTIGYTVRDGVFGWTGESSLTAEDLSQPPMLREERERSAGCKDWLASFLSDGAVDAITVKAVAKENGYGRRQLDAAKDALGVQLKRITLGNKGDGGWMWMIPQEVGYDVYNDTL